jgi:hypothetical protein
MYTKIQFGHDLKERICKKQSVAEIGSWTYEIFLDYSDAFDDNFLNMLITLNTMELGPEFAFTYEELNKVADDLIAGHDVNLD